ncbi:MAG: hypothetical protein H7138_00750 [Myxococcales bacterium]|nr:hypothetical protein [Myxococcales bacterium]
MRITNLRIALFGLCLAAGCRGGGNNNDNPDAAGMPGDGSNSGDGSTSIQDLQSDKVVVGAPVELKGVIVTAIDAFGANAGDNMWVQEPEGGAFSGVHVFRGKATGIKVGDVVTISGGVKSEFMINGDTDSVTEIQAPQGGSMTVTKTGTAPVPAPQVVDVLAIGIKATEAERSAEWEKWEGVLITTTNVVAFGNPSCITSRGNCTDATRTNLSITGVAKLESNLAAFPTFKAGDCFASVTGVVDYVFDYVIFPRTTDDVVTGGTGCVRELSNGAANLCADALDNDGNGFNDCKDFSCQAGPGAWRGATCTAADATCGCSANLPLGTSVNKANTGTVGPVILNDVFVTAVTPTGFWIADALQAASNGGTFVFTSATPPAADVVIGAKLPTVQGISGTFGTKTEKLVQISIPTAATAVAGGAVLPFVSNATTLSSLVDGRPFAGSLVQVSNVKVTAIDATNKRVTLRENVGGATITMDDNIFVDYTGAVPAVDTCYATVTGIMDLQTNDQVRLLNPRFAADLVPCPI